MSSVERAPSALSLQDIAEKGPKPKARIAMHALVHRLDMVRDQLEPEVVQFSIDGIVGAAIARHMISELLGAIELASPKTRNDIKLTLDTKDPNRVIH